MLSSLKKNKKNTPQGAVRKLIKLLREYIWKCVFSTTLKTKRNHNMRKINNDFGQLKEILETNFEKNIAMHAEEKQENFAWLETGRYHGVIVWV